MDTSNACRIHQPIYYFGHEYVQHDAWVSTEHPQIHVVSGEIEVEVTFEERRWVFPRGDCILLKMPNTTAELLACYIGHRLLDALETRLGHRLHAIRIEVDENHGQWGIWDWRA